MCKHRLGAFFDHTLAQIALDTWHEIFNLANETHSTTVTAQVRTQYAYEGSVYKQRSELIAYRLGNHSGWMTIPDTYFTMRDLNQAMLQKGWQVADNGQLIVGRHYRGHERWTLEPMEAYRQQLGGDVATAIHSLYGIDAELFEDRQRERSIMEMWEADHV